MVARVRFESLSQVPVTPPGPPPRPSIAKAFLRSFAASRGGDDFLLGLFASVIGHAILVGLLLIKAVSSLDFEKPIVYSISIEGGSQIGGISQTPKDDKKSILAPPKKVSEKAEQASTSKEKANEPKRREDPKKAEVKKNKVEDAEVSLAEKKKLEKQREAEVAAAKRADEEKKRQKRDAEEREAEKEYQRAMQRYLGESTKAGGTGFGAAALGGKGMGGGTQRSPEWIDYYNRLSSHIKRGWRWYDDSRQLVAKCSFAIAPDGRVSEVKILVSSGNREFDDSALRAVEKANPVPPPPPSVYQDFRKPTLTFDSRE